MLHVVNCCEKQCIVGIDGCICAARVTVQNIRFTIRVVPSAQQYIDYLQAVVYKLYNSMPVVPTSYNSIVRAGKPAAP